MLVIVFYFKMALQRDNLVKVSALYVGHKVRDHKPCRSFTTIHVIKHMDDGKGVNRHAGSGPKTVVDCDCLRDVIQSSPLNCISKLSQSTSVNHCKHFCWHLHHHPYTSLLHGWLCKSPWQGLQPGSPCVLHEEVQYLSVSLQSHFEMN